MFHQLKAVLIEMDRADRRRRRPTLGVRLGVRLYERVAGRPCFTTHRPIDIGAMARDGLGPHLAITPARDGWPHLFVIVHVPTGRPLFGGSGCITCCRRVARALADSGADWGGLRVGNGVAWLDQAPDETRRAIADHRLGLDCAAEADGPPCPDGAPLEGMVAA